jgi:hypothetical protein
VAVSEFFFAVDLFGARDAGFLDEVVSRILQQAGGGSPDRVPGMIAAVQAAVAEAAAVPQQGCRLSFVALNGHLEISVTSAAGRLWQTRHPLG